MKKCDVCILGLELSEFEGAYQICETDIIEFTDRYKNLFFERYNFCPICGIKIDWKAIDDYISKYSN